MSSLKKTFSLNTLGCRLNQHESEAIASSFLQAGFVQAETGVTNVNVAVLNSCAVTSKSEQKTRREARQMAVYAQVVLVTGCSANVSGQELTALNSNVVVVSQKQALLELPSYLKGQKPEDLLALSKQFISSYRSQTEGVFNFEAPQTVLRTRASLKIQDGCDKICSYCITRIARGKSLSLKAKMVVARLKQLQEQNHKEVVLTGVNLASYQDDEVGGLWDLLRLIFKETEGFRIRLSSLEPHTITENMADLLSHPRLCRFFHLSIQSGSDIILHKMRRPYLAQTVKDAVNIIRRYSKNPFLSADIIAGFPGETEADFAQTLQLLQEIDLAYIHAFAYSTRQGTEAATMKPIVPEYIRDQRVALLKSFSAIQCENYYKSCVGQTYEAIIETDREGNLCRVRTDNYLDLWLEEGEKNLPTLKAGSLVIVKAAEGRKALLVD